MSDDTPLLPFDDDNFDAAAPQKAGQALLGDQPFAYIGQALDIAGFAAYVASYRFGTIPPEYVVLHHTANPDASWAPLSSNPGTKWDRGETGMNVPQIRIKRQGQLDAIQRYYASLGWSAGPHLFIDERWIWLMTPMYDVGIHAKSGNSYRDRSSTLHYSIGIEVVGYYEKQVWPAAVARNVGMAVAILRRRLGTFALEYRPGPRNTPAAHLGSLSSHRDYNKLECPGAAITEAYYVSVAQQCWRELLTSGIDAPADERWYTVKPAVTGGATIRSAPRQNAAVLGRLHAGDVWQGEPVTGQTVTIAGFGSSNQWICDSTMRYVAAVLLEERKTK